MLIFWPQNRGNAIGKAKGSVWLRKQQFDSLPVQSKALRLPMLSFVRSVKLK